MEGVPEIVNRSGYPFQDAVESVLCDLSVKRRYRVVCSEHYWADPPRNRAGYIDMIFNQEISSTRFIIECKRINEGKWIFTLPNEPMQRKIFRVLQSESRPDGSKRSTWFQVPIDPESYISPNCIMSYKGKKDNLEKDTRTMTEYADNLLASAEAFMESDEDDKDDIRKYVPLLITNAELITCRYESKDIQLNRGEIGDHKVETVPYIRYSKYILTKYGCEFHEVVRFSRSMTAALNYRSQRHVMIVNADHIKDFFNRWNYVNDWVLSADYT